MNLSALATLSAILDEGSFAAAAEKIGRTPSAVSLQVKQLEQFFGQPLFDRSGRTVRPTPFATEVERVARECVRAVNSLRTHRERSVSGRWRLGSISTQLTDALPAALRDLRDRHPFLEVVLTVQDSNILLRDLKAARIDGAVVVRPANGGTSRALLWEPLVAQPFVLLAPAASRDGTPQQLLDRLGWIRYDTALTGGTTAARFVRRIAPQASVKMSLRPIEAIVAMVAAGLGVSVVPRPRPALLQAHGVGAISLGRKAPVRNLCFVTRAGDADSPNSVAVLDALRRAYDAFQQ